jgi:hypothetical protein
MHVLHLSHLTFWEFGRFQQELGSFSDSFGLFAAEEQCFLCLLEAFLLAKDIEGDWNCALFLMSGYLYREVHYCHGHSGPHELCSRISLLADIYRFSLP